MTYMKTNYDEGYGFRSSLTSCSGELQRLTRQDRLDEAIALLLELVDATEEDNLFTGRGVTAIYYEQLANIFRKRKEYAKEIAILTRYIAQGHASKDSRQDILQKRLEKAKRRLSKQETRH